MEAIAEARTNGAALEPAVEDERAWARLGRAAGYVAAIGFAVMTILFMLDELDMLDAAPEYVRTSSGALQDEATFWAAQFAHQYRVLWDVVVRDVVGSVAYVALIVLALAVRRRIASDRPEPQLIVWFFTIGGMLAVVANLLYLANVESWRQPGWTATEGQVSMVAVGRATTAINNLTTWPEAFAYLVIAAGMLCLARIATRGGTLLPRRLSTLAYVTAAALVGLGVSQVLADVDTVRQILSVAVGIVLAPWVAVWLARRVGRLEA
jgi:hypothetical protein